MSGIDTVFKKVPYSGNWLPVSAVEVPNRSMNFGDGLFETMVFTHSEIRFFVYHLDRIKRGMALLGMDLTSLDSEGILFFLKDNFKGECLRVRWNIYRSGSGKYTPPGSSTEQLLHISVFQAAPRVKSKAVFARDVQLYPTVWSSFKTLNCLPYILANMERVRKEADEIILLDYRGYLSEAGSSNLFWLSEGVIYTPALSCGCLDGIARRVILERAKARLSVVEGEFLPEVLKSAEQVWVSNATGISYLKEIEGVKYATDSQQFLESLLD